MAHDVRDLPGGPWYVALARTILTTQGPTALLAIALAGFLGYAVWGRLNVIENNQSLILTDMNEARAAMSSFSATHTQQERERSLLLGSQIKLLRQLCVNAARNEAQTRACLVE